MTDNTTTAVTKPKKLKINVIDIRLASGATARHYVRHYDPRQAKAWLLEDNVDARVASQDEIVDMVKGNFNIQGPFEKPVTALDDDQADFVGQGGDLRQ